MNKNELQTKIENAKENERIIDTQTLIVDKIKYGYSIAYKPKAYHEHTMKKELQQHYETSFFPEYDEEIFAKEGLYNKYILYTDDGYTSETVTNFICDLQTYKRN